MRPRLEERRPEMLRQPPVLLNVKNCISVPRPRLQSIQRCARVPASRRTARACCVVLPAPHHAPWSHHVTPAHPELSSFKVVEKEKTDRDVKATELKAKREAQKARIAAMMSKVSRPALMSRPVWWAGGGGYACARTPAPLLRGAGCSHTDSHLPSLHHPGEETDARHIDHIFLPSVARGR
jgi:hypothetical protein